MRTQKSSKRVMPARGRTMHRMHRGKPHRLKYPRVSAEPLCKESHIVKLNHRLSAKVEAIKTRAGGNLSAKSPKQKLNAQSHAKPNRTLESW